MQTASPLQSRRFVYLLLIRMRMRSGAVPVRLAAVLVGGCRMFLSAVVPAISRIFQLRKNWLEDQRR
jgi:hypothetical protein